VRRRRRKSADDSVIFETAIFKDNEFGEGETST
jgi:hypothetical protein